MTTREKILLLATLMQDIRYSWDIKEKKRIKDKRVWKCLELIDELDLISKNYDHEDNKIVYAIDWFEFYKRIGVYLVGRHEGSILRASICDGGYHGLEAFHQLDLNSSQLSEEFHAIKKELCRHF